MPGTSCTRLTIILPSSSTVGASASTTTSYGPVTASTRTTPGTPEIAPATSRALPTSVCMRMYAWTTTRLPRCFGASRHRYASARPRAGLFAVKLPYETGTYRPGVVLGTGRPAMTVADTGEFGLIDRITARLAGRTERVLLGPGDDAAIVAAPDARVVASTDVLVAGRHFRTDWSSGLDVGHRAAAANLADIAAMGATPTALLVALCTPPDLEVRWVEELADGLGAEAALAGASVVGGDISASTVLTIAVTALGDLGGAAA